MEDTMLEQTVQKWSRNIWKRWNETTKPIRVLMEESWRRGSAQGHPHLFRMRRTANRFWWFSDNFVPECNSNSSRNSHPFGLPVIFVNYDRCLQMVLDIVFNPSTPSWSPCVRVRMIMIMIVCGLSVRPPPPLRSPWNRIVSSACACAQTALAVRVCVCLRLRFPRCDCPCIRAACEWVSVFVITCAVWSVCVARFDAAIRARQSVRLACLPVGLTDGQLIGGRCSARSSRTNWRIAANKCDVSQIIIVVPLFNGYVIIINYCFYIRTVAR